MVGLVALGTFIETKVKTYRKEQKQAEVDRIKADELRQDARDKIQKEKDSAQRLIDDAASEALRREVQTSAELLRKDTEMIATGVKHDIETRFSLTEKQIDNVNANTKEYIKALIEGVYDRIKTTNDSIGDVDDKATRMLSDLTKRADLTNGNVAAIRTEIQNNTEQVQDIWNRLEQEAEEDEIPATIPVKKRRLSDKYTQRRRTQLQSNKTKREDIQRDSESQEQVKHNY